ncbi:MAG: response regulator [Deltaproteobacteria bacterium]|nr:response regulator [Deltaproteobacteria bacterium]
MEHYYRSNNKITSNPTIIIVDDDPLFRAMTADALKEEKEESYDVIEAESGEEALEIMHNSLIDAAIVDLFLPGMNGLELLMRIAKTKPDVLRILVSAKANKDQVITSINKARVHAVLLKPLDYPKFLVLLKELRSERSRMLQAERLAAIGELVGGVAHELNNPLTAVIGFTELLLKDADMESSREDLNNILSASKRAARIVKNLSAFAVPARKGQEEVELNSLLRAVAELETKKLKQSGIDLFLDLDQSSPTCFGNPTALRRMMTNILENAKQACMDDSSRVEGKGKKRNGRIWLRTRNNDDSFAELQVEDDGVGIAPQHIHRIFEPFFSTRDLKPGRGLGLAVAHGIAHSHGGHIMVESEPGKGSLFRIILPAAYTDTGPVAAPRNSCLTSRTVLVVDDEPGIRDFLNRLLTREGMDVTTTDTSIGALHLFKGGFVPDVILCDLRLPDMDGSTLRRKTAKSYPELARRFVFITGDTANERSLTFMDQSSAPCLEKPFTRDQLMDALELIASTGNKASKASS